MSELIQKDKGKDMAKEIDMVGKVFGRLKVVSMGLSKKGRIFWNCECQCKNIISVNGTYLRNGDVTSCGCAKAELEAVNLREKYEEKRIDGVAIQLFKGKEPRKDSLVGYRGVHKYYTRVKREERYRAWITVKGKRYYMSGFLTPKEAYYNGRLLLEDKYLPEKNQ